MTYKALAYIRQQLKSIPEFGERVYLETPPSSSSLPLVVYSTSNVVRYPTLKNPSRVVSLIVDISVQVGDSSEIVEIMQKVENAIETGGRHTELEYRSIEEDEVAGVNEDETMSLWHGEFRYKVREGR